MALYVKIGSNNVNNEVVTVFPVNCWYVAAASGELQEKPLGRTICNQKVVLYRKSDGQVAAVENYCPHRGLPLSLGFVEGDNLVCGYHGLAVNCQGKCESMPSQPRGVERLRGVSAFPVVERYGFIWLWPGEATAADPALVPALDWAESDQWTFGGGYYHMACDYRLLVDNLMDLTHETYVHASSIGQPEIDEAEPVVTREDDHVSLARYMENIQPPPFWQAALIGNGLDPNQACDRWQVCHFYPPGQVMIEVGVAHAGNGGQQAGPEHRVSGVVVDLITPETDTTCHYFWGMARDFNVADQKLTEDIRINQGKIFAEDLEVLEEQQKNILAFPDRRLTTLNTDSGGAFARQVIQQWLRREGSAVSDAD